HQGIFLIFRKVKDKLEYLERKYRRDVLFEITKIDPVTKELRKVRVFKPKLNQLIKDSPFFENVLEFVLKHGRLPLMEESNAYCKLLKEFKSKSKVSALIMNNVDAHELKNVRERRSNDLLVIFALMRFTRKKFPAPEDVPTSTLYDIKNFFGGYRQFLSNAETLLFMIGDEKRMGEVFNSINVGKILPDAIYIHPSYLKGLPPAIRVKVGVAESLIGDVDDCNLIKINKIKDKVSFLVYEDFDNIEHPALMFSYVINIPKAQIKEWDFTTRENPPILHRKETFVSPDYPLYEKFRTLSKEEEAFDLLGRHNIGTMFGWEECLLKAGLGITNHRVTRIDRKVFSETLQVTN
ncbi:MAG: DNA phosphorothioation-associated putative methyltransferase, partial [Halobacteriovoraceae bacterium]|nr:DNA phosphorothioation-associated putative methyltransferase [Halobacteriovoraceae bacterium]